MWLVQSILQHLECPIRCSQNTVARLDLRFWMYVVFVGYVVRILIISSHLHRLKSISKPCFFFDESHFLTPNKNIMDSEAQSYANDWGVLGLVGMQARDRPARKRPGKSPLYSWNDSVLLLNLLMFLKSWPFLRKSGGRKPQSV